MENTNNAKPSEEVKPSQKANPLGNVVVHSSKDIPKKLLIVAIVLAVLFGAFFLFYWPGRMVKYTDSDKGFSFSHPANWKELNDEEVSETFGDIVGEMSGMDILVILGRDIDKDDSKNAVVFKVTKTDIPPGSPLISVQDSEFKEGINQVLEYYAEQYSGLEEIGDEDIEIDGIPAWKKIISLSDEENETRTVFVFMIDEKSMYYFAFATNIEVSKGLINAGDKAIKSFKFTE